MSTTNLPINGRDAALEALVAHGRSGAFIDDAIEDVRDRSHLDSLEAGLAHELAMGVVRHRLTLDRLISAFLKGRLTSLRAELLGILRMAVYQLVWLERIPPFAAVNAAVEQAKRRLDPKSGGLTNALLRELLRHMDETIQSDPPPPRRAVRIDRRRWRSLTVDLFDDPASDRAAYLALSTSHPQWLVQRWLKTHGADAAERVCLTGNLKPPLVLRPNGLRINAEELLARLTREETVATRDPHGEAIFVLHGPPARRMPVVMEGVCQPQDMTAQAVVRAAPPKPGQRVLDLCAAPGTKTTQLAECMDNHGVILACDRSEEKIELIRDSCRRMGVTCVRTVIADHLDETAARLGPFDLTLVDAPCSNTGVLSRRADARYRLKPSDPAALAEEQFKLLSRAAHHVRQGAKLVYSTCSIEPEEDEQTIQRFLAGRPDWRIEKSHLTLPTSGDEPTDWRDGGFVAVMRRV